MENIEGFISSEMRFPNEKSKKKKRYVKFVCPACGNVDDKVYIKSQFVNLCTHCAKGGFTTKDFIQRGKEHFGGMYGYLKTIYVNKRTKVTITCPIHGDFEQTAQEHLEGHGCNQCKFDHKRDEYILPKETWLKRIQEYPLIKFNGENQIKNYHGKVSLICDIHGEFETTLGQVGNSKHLCNYCANFSHQTQSIKKEYIGKVATLYYIYLKDIDMYKLGVTVNPKIRLLKFNNFDLLLEHELDYINALKLEHSLHISNSHLRYNGTKKLIPVGSTELYKTDILSDISRALQE